MTRPLSPAFARILSKSLFGVAIVCQIVGWTLRTDEAAIAVAAVVVGAILGVLSAYIWEHQDRSKAVDWLALLAILAMAVGYLPPPWVQIGGSAAVILAFGSGFVLRRRASSLVDQETNASPTVTVDSSGVSHPPLAGEWRAASAILAAGALGGGAYAVFVTDNEIGSSTLMAIGVLFAVITLLGYVPRVRIGDTDIDPMSWAKGALDGVERTTQAVEQAARSAQTPDEVVERSKAEREHLERQYRNLVVHGAASSVVNRTWDQYLKQALDDMDSRSSGLDTKNEKPE